VVADDAGKALVARIVTHIRRFRLRDVKGDILKVLYESLIDASQRHGLGEYYTPDWLASKVIRHVVKAPLEQKVLDPACGSGAFVFHAVRRMIEEAPDNAMPANRIADEATRLVAGMALSRSSSRASRTFLPSRQCWPRGKARSPFPSISVTRCSSRSARCSRARNW
jgi:hypothetical protein